MRAWSYSALTAFETCPLRFYITRVARTVREPESDAIRWGNYVHKALETRLRDGAELPTTLAGYEGLCQQLEASGTVLAEHEAVINPQFKATGWWAKDVWCRAKWDVAVEHPSQPVLAIYDWKTGKRKPDSQQLELSAGLAFVLRPELEAVRAGFVWLPDRKIDSTVYTRPKAKEIWATFIPRVKRFELAHEENRWPAKPSGLCRKHCPVGRQNCDHCGS